MIDPAQPIEEEIVLLKQHYRKTGGSVSCRAHAVLLSFLGKTLYETAQVLFVEEKTAREWIKACNKTRMASLFSRSHGNQNASRLTDIQREEIARVLERWYDYRTTDWVNYLEYPEFTFKQTKNLLQL